MLIRIATTHDIPSILELLKELGRPQSSDGEAFDKVLTQYLIDSDKEILVACDKLNVIGMISLLYLTRLNHITLEMYIAELIVNEKYQNKGIGKRLVNSCIAFAEVNKCHRIRLDSGIKRKDAHLFYNKIGFDQSSISFAMKLEYSY